MVWVNRLLLAALLVFAVAYLPQRIGTGAGADDLARVAREHAELAQRNQRLREEIAALQAEVAALKRDPELNVIHTLGYVAHVDTATIEAARAAGVDQVLARSAFVDKLGEILTNG